MVRGPSGSGKLRGRRWDAPCGGVSFGRRRTPEDRLIGLSDIEAAARGLEGVARRTPLLESRLLNRDLGGRLLFKAECLQRGGAFKIRGAYTRVRAALAEARRAGVVAYSSGNHGIATALAAHLLGCQAVVVMPEDASKAKVAAVKAYGGDVVFAGLSSDDRRVRAEEIAAARGALVIPPYDDDLIIAGQGTVALEILEDAPDTDVILAPVGGGGLLAGIATAARGVKPSVKVYGCEAELANDAHLSLRFGRIVRIGLPATLADGMRNLCLAERTFEILRERVEDVLLVSEAEIAGAVGTILAFLKVLAEPTGAVAPAAAFARRIDLAGRTAVAVISGGNVDMATLVRILKPVPARRRK